MEPIDKTKSDVLETDADDLPSVDEFIKQLEEREKDLDISSDLVIEVGESEVEHENIHDSFVSQADVEIPKEPAPVVEAEPVINSAASDATGSEEVRELREKLSALQADRDDIRDALHRQKRDFEGYRSRIEREREKMFINMVGRLATQMLPVLDNLNRALDSYSGDTESKPMDPKDFLEGIVLVNQQLNEVLTGMGVQPIPAVGEPFDPNIHEAVATEPDEKHPPNTVTQELLRGYRVDETVIRASMVKVSAAHSPKDSPDLEVE
ncbi:MAG: nucleotide exchange factor GrpE [Pyrinomonadaceae bacterium]|nr:nucleotide exchange factor GrpE [Pyrinomonadaceae bacterium]